MSTTHWLASFPVQQVGKPASPASSSRAARRASRYSPATRPFSPGGPEGAQVNRTGAEYQFFVPVPVTHATPVARLTVAFFRAGCQTANTIPEYGQQSENFPSDLHLVLRKPERTGNRREIADIVMESISPTTSPNPITRSLRSDRPPHAPDAPTLVPGSRGPTGLPASYLSCDRCGSTAAASSRAGG